MIATTMLYAPSISNGAQMNSTGSDANGVLALNWQAALRKVFPSGVPDAASWTDKHAIAGVLAAIARPSTGHMFYPDHGGDDLVSAISSTQSDDWVELHSDDTDNWPHIVRPASLAFVCPHNCEWMAHFLLKSADISSEPEFPDSASEYFEEYAEASSGKRFTLSQWNNDDDGNGGSLPPDTRRVLKYWKAGTIAIFAKCSPYNQISLPGFDAYSAVHLDEPRFASVVSKLTELALERS